MSMRRKLRPPQRSYVGLPLLTTSRSSNDDSALSSVDTKTV